MKKSLGTKAWSPRTALWKISVRKDGTWTEQERRMPAWEAMFLLQRLQWDRVRGRNQGYEVEPVRGS